MKRKNLMFSTCVVFIIVLVIISLLVGIYHRVYRTAISVQINPTQPAIALTFDDGPNSCYTPQLLDV